MHYKNEKLAILLVTAVVIGTSLSRHGLRPVTTTGNVSLSNSAFNDRDNLEETGTR